MGSDLAIIELPDYYSVPIVTFRCISTLYSSVSPEEKGIAKPFGEA